MTTHWQSGVFTMEFGHEFEAERERWLRGRFLWYTGVVGAIGLLRLLGAPIGASSAHWISLAALGAGTALYGGAFVYAWRHAQERATLVRIVTGLIIAYGVLALLGNVGARPATPAGGAGGMSVGAQWALSIFATHLLACLFLPLTPRESLRPLIPLLVLNAIMALASDDSWIIKTLGILSLPLVGAPGALICWYRHGKFRERFTNRMLKSRFGALRQELSNARMIHEALFPAPAAHGPLRFDYVYEPMREIGGDFLYVSFGPAIDGAPAPLNLVVLDVTGHGIAAALTVNRLHGELERIYAERPDTPPGEALGLLNRYVHLTLATHSIYATALCVRIDPARSALEYASGGHPPAFIRGADGTMHELDSTALVLGAAPADVFETETHERRFGPGDSLIAYTDGAIEAPGRDGAMLRIQGMRRIIAAPGGGRRQGTWCAHIAEAIKAHRHGPAADDTLIIEVAWGAGATVGSGGGVAGAAAPKPAAQASAGPAAAVSS
jgi:hypothetical protein